MRLVQTFPNGHIVEEAEKMKNSKQRYSRDDWKVRLAEPSTESHERPDANYSFCEDNGIRMKM